MMRPYFCFWKCGQTALQHCSISSVCARPQASPWATIFSILTLDPHSDLLRWAVASPAHWIQRRNHIRPRCLVRLLYRLKWRYTYPVCAAQVHRDDLIPHLFVHTHERLVPQNARVGNEDMDSAKGVETSLDDLLALFGRADGGYGFTASCSVSLWPMAFPISHTAISCTLITR